MARTTKQLIDENNDKRKQLNEEDLEVYEDFLLYVRTDLRVSEHETEVILMDVLDHLLEAVSHGSSAIEFFGHDVKGHADEILEELPNESNKAVMKMVMMGVAYFYSVYFIISGIVGIFADYKTPLISALSLLILVPIGGFFIIKMLFNIIQRYIFDKSQYKKFKETAYAGLVVGVIPAILILVPHIIFKDMMRVYIPWWIYLVIGIAIYTVYRISKKNEQN
ncbi:DUF1129 family protein [Mammaliicoccus vitulinus]|uniref:DUF1129 family protein n=1 Tax=Mammaliicoccus vitulinus TaxID=71237 RepID=UPI000D1D3C3E|nr:DUF1129 family protein [Mammaliicoccus vitulinus]PTI90871.1 hypothetical protein BU071_01195 [Mammaliicoccus vitulinus]QQT15523.1 DUF1129 family protein [Mammaliicoccus vitulinus]QQY19175.1 DUF1129 family protein [Mammaliicoccus vitulinus]RIN17337.1 DUF1129 family protein [Mammaliicoccus vitulinus]RTX84294.1 DUF1129 family protein [Mammaliicoccus vitulinus]